MLKPEATAERALRTSRPPVGAEVLSLERLKELASAASEKGVR